VKRPVVILAQNT